MSEIKEIDLWVKRNLNNYGNCYVSYEMVDSYGGLDQMEKTLGFVLTSKQSECNPKCCVISIKKD